MSGPAAKYGLRTSAQTLGNGEISQALRKLGVARGSEEDEFDALGLGKYRSNRHWVARAIVNAFQEQAAERQDGLLRAVEFEHRDQQLRERGLTFAFEDLKELGSLAAAIPLLRALANTDPDDLIRRHAAWLLAEAPVD